jgi:Cof subfamily protein (haloacid dehalogenase superfamily)
MAKKTLAFDLDGTLTDSTNQIPVNTASFLAKYTETNDIYIATGRPLKEVKYHIASAGIKKGYVLCYGGSLLYSIENARIMNTLSFSSEEINSIAHIAAVNGLVLAVVTPDESYGYSFNNLADGRYSNIINSSVEIKFSSDFYNFKTTILGLKNIVAVWLFAIPDTKYANDKITKIRSTLVKWNEFTVFSTRKNDLILTNKKATKYRRLVEIMRKNGVEPEDVIYFGDGIVDIECLKNFGYGIAMQNAFNVVKSSAKEVTLSNDDEGVYYWINKNINKLS